MGDEEAVLFGLPLSAFHFPSALSGNRRRLSPDVAR
jgi:hypothetical protein